MRGDNKENWKKRERKTTEGRKEKIVKSRTREKRMKREL